MPTLAEMLGQGSVARNPKQRMSLGDIVTILRSGAFSELSPMHTGLVKINPESWETLVARWPVSENVEDRRMMGPSNPFLSAATGYVPGRGYVTDPIAREIMRTQEAKAR